jgi:phage terminase small subunit
MALNQRKIRFAHMVAEGKPPVNAYVDAGYSENGAAQSCSKLLKETEVAEEIEHWREKLAEIAGLNPNWVLNQWKMIAEANPSELIQLHQVCCRHCWGVGHQFQWREGEYLRAVELALGAKEPKDPPAADGGFGFDGTREPNPNCPECDGEGQETVRVTDSRKVKGSAARLYAGLKKTKDGIQVLMRDQDGAVKNIAQYLGMLIAKNELSGPGGGPISVGVVAKDFTEEQLAAIVAGGS